MTPPTNYSKVMKKFSSFSGFGSNKAFKMLLQQDIATLQQYLQYPDKTVQNMAKSMLMGMKQQQSQSQQQQKKKPGPKPKVESMVSFTRSFLISKYERIFRHDFSLTIESIIVKQ